MAANETRQAGATHGADGGRGTRGMRLYDLLLHLYPASFRNEYADEMRPLFAQRRRAARGLDVFSLWSSTIAEVFTNATGAHLDVLKQDVAYTARLLARAPGFTLTAILIVALGIGATTAAFSLADFVLLRPLPFPEADRLVKIWETTPGYSRMELSGPNYRDWTGAARSYESVGMYHADQRTLLGRGEPRMLRGAAVSASLFPTLRVAPVLGRPFTAEDDRSGAPGTIILSHRLWQAEFGGDPDIAGRRVLFEDETYTVLGVMPRDFHFPTSDALFWTPTRFGEQAFIEGRTNNWLEAVGRLRPGVTLQQARVEMETIAAQSELRYPKDNKDTGASVIALRTELSERSRLLLIALLGAAFCVLLIACANLANLLLARALARRRELTVRTALGAGRERLVRQLMTESLLLAFAGGALGVTIAVLSVPLLAQLVPSSLPIAETPSVDLRVLLFALVLTMVTGLAFGLAPVLRSGRTPALDGLREGARAGGGQKERLRSALVVAEIATCVVLLVSAGLLLRALLTVRAVDPGFAAEGVLTLRTELPMPVYEEVAKREAFYARVQEEVRALPEVRSAGFISFLPISSFRGGIWPVIVKGDVESAGDIRSAHNVAGLRYVTSGYFEAMAIPIEQGRAIDASDRRDRPFTAVVSESFVRRYWPGQNPIGKQFTFAFAEREVVGVARDVRFRGLERESEPQVYLSSQQVPDGAITFYAPKALAIRTSGEPARLAQAVRAIVQRADPKVPITELQALTDLVDRDTASRAVQVRVLALFAAVAFVLAAVGIHGLLSFAVSQRTQEIGLRIALGALSTDILWMIVRRCLTLAVAGIIPGVLLAFVAGRSMQALLAGVPPADALTLAVAVGFSLVMTIAGGLAPALRALRVDPLTALRAE